MKIEQILAYVDVDDLSKRIIERTAWLAENYDASVELFACVYDQFVDSDEGISNVLRDNRKRLGALAASMSSGGVTVTVDNAWARSWDDALLEKIETSKPDLVAKQTHDRSMVERVLLTNEDWKLIIKCRKPLLLVRDRAIAQRPTILASVDPLHAHDKTAALDHQILNVASELAERCDGSIHAVHVVDTIAAQVAPTTFVEPAGGAPPVAPVAEHRSAEATRDRLLKSARQAFDRLLREESIRRTQGHLLEGDIAPELAACAGDLGADFVVMGAVSRGMLEKVIIGHTAKQVMDQIDCDLIVVK